MLWAEMLMALSALLSTGGLGAYCWTRCATKKKAGVKPPLDWCDGCDQTKSRASMAFTEIGLYRCATCRDEDEPQPVQPKEKKAKKKKEPRTPAPSLARIRRGEVAPQPLYQALLNTMIHAQVERMVVEEVRCWDCDTPHPPPAGRCAACAAKFEQERHDRWRKAFPVTVAKPLSDLELSDYEPLGSSRAPDFGGLSNCLTTDGRVYQSARHVMAEDARRLAAHITIPPLIGTPLTGEPTTGSLRDSTRWSITPDKKHVVIHGYGGAVAQEWGNNRGDDL